MRFADRLRELREQAGMTQAQLAEAAGLPLGSIRNYEQGQREPYWTAIFKLADALGTTCAAFGECVNAEEEATARPKGRPRSRPLAGPAAEASLAGPRAHGTKAEADQAGKRKGDQGAAEGKKPRGRKARDNQA